TSFGHLRFGLFNLREPNQVTCFSHFIVKTLSRFRAPTSVPFVDVIFLTAIEVNYKFNYKTYCKATPCFCWTL
ncbi:hypothetical protein AAHB56_27750, partial [Bacillus thuringiensis]